MKNWKSRTLNVEVIYPSIKLTDHLHLQAGIPPQIQYNFSFFLESFSSHGAPETDRLSIPNVVHVFVVFFYLNNSNNLESHGLMALDEAIHYSYSPWSIRLRIYACFR